MTKKSKIKTPEWILKGEEPPKKKKSGKTFKIRKCPNCGSDEVHVKVGDVGVWQCPKCGFEGKNVQEVELSEDEFMKYLDEKGEEVA